MPASKSARARSARGGSRSGRSGAGRAATAGRSGAGGTARGPRGGGGGNQAQPQAARDGGSGRGSARLQLVPEATDAAAASQGPPLWFQLTTLALALGGLGVSIYETYAHFTGSHLAGCTGTGTEDCTKVITSPQSMVFGVIPVAILGLAFYAFVVAIMTPWAWRMRRREVAWLRLAAMIVGMGFVLYLVYAELFQIGSICLYCTSVHAITFVLFVMTVFAAATWGLAPGRRPG
ncbi:MAG: vitamin K epoxide reductase family protein [Streptosporangiaceae bacterium]|nr:vitamin K epoxide reductase family protein [Streptosporangiaceae bacterium]